MLADDRHGAFSEAVSDAALAAPKNAPKRLGPAGPDGAVGAGHVVAGTLHLLPVLVGLLVDHLEVATQLGDELLAGHRAGAAPKVTGSKHIADDGLVLGLQGSGLRADEGAVGVNISELVINAHRVLLLMSKGYAAVAIAASG